MFNGKEMNTNLKSEVMAEENRLPLPKSKMPVCWDDDMKMNYLFSFIRPATVNPMDSETKMKFWSGLLEEWCLHHKRPAFTIGELMKTFQRDGSIPACLPAVIENMYRNGDLVTKSNFIYASPNKTWTSWTVDLLVKKPAVWAFTKVKDSIIKASTLPEDTVLVHVSACKTLGKKFIGSQHRNKLLELSELAEFWGQNDLEQVLVLVHGLRQDGKAAIQEGSPTLIKLGDPNITDIDIGIHTLKKNEQTLSRHLEQLEAEKQAAIEEARIFVAKNMRQAARSCLRKKHVLDQCIDKRMSALDNVRVLLSRIREAETDAKVLEAYKFGSSALKSTLKTSGLTEDSAADTMLQVQEVLDVHDEIKTALSQPAEPDDDLEKELAQLLKDSELPEVPKQPVGYDDLQARLDALSTANLPELPKSRREYPKVPVAQPAL